jgi:hypothetical protein
MSERAISGRDGSPGERGMGECDGSPGERGWASATAPRASGG